MGLDIPILNFTTDPKIIFNHDSVIKHHPRIFDGIREVSFYKQLNHPHIITCEDAEIYEYYVKIYDFPPTANDEMSMMKIKFKRYTPLDELCFDYQCANKLLNEISDTLAYLEVNGILHSDVKPDNIFYDKNNDKFLLADFDLVTYNERYFRYRVATPTTRPPEMTNENNVICYRSDVFSLAVTVTTLLIGSWYPTERIEQCKENEYNNKMNITLDSLDGNLIDKNLLYKCLSFNPNKRPLPSELAKIRQSIKYYKSIKMNYLDLCGLKNVIKQDLLVGVSNNKGVRKNDNDDEYLCEYASKISSTYLSLTTDDFTPLQYFMAMMCGFILAKVMTYPNDEYMCYKQLPDIFNDDFTSLIDGLYISKNVLNEKDVTSISDAATNSIKARRFIKKMLIVLDFKVIF